jgi:hypothetical protein
MAYDPSHVVTVLFGGIANNKLQGDTWILTPR